MIGKTWLAMILLASAPAMWAAASSADDPDVGFPVGGEISYRIYWGFIPVGYSVARTEWVEEDGRKLLHIIFKTRTNKVLETLYPVEDYHESFVDPDTFLPVRFIKKQKEGKYRSDEVTTFDHKAGKAVWKSLLSGDTKEYDINPDMRDLVSFMYSVRNMDFTIGKPYYAQVMADERIYDLEVDVLKREKSKTVDGEKVESIKLEPKAKFEGLFVRKGKMFLWVSEDKPHVITKVAAKVPFAHVTLVLDLNHEDTPGEDKD